MNYHRTITLLALALLVGEYSGLANERKFTYTYESSVLPRGVRELEIWNTYRRDRSYFYRRLDQRIEFEVGVSNNLQTAFYLNTEWKVADDSMGSGGGNAASSVGVSVSNEWKLKLMDRVADPVGLALYGEATLGLDETELEAKLILDKQQGPYLFALNAVIEHERETEFAAGTEALHTEFNAELVGGISYTLGDNVSVGVETRSVNTYINGDLKISALFAGPSIAYSGESYWATFAVMPQLTAFKGATANGLNLDDHEKVEARLLFSFHL